MKSPNTFQNNFSYTVYIYSSTANISKAPQIHQMSKLAAKAILETFLPLICDMLTQLQAILLFPKYDRLTNTYFVFIN